MTTRPRYRFAAALLAATAAPTFAQTADPAQTPANAPVNRMIVFGDSLADGGYYLTLDPRIPRDAGSFTTNPDPVAPEVTAAALGLPLLPVYGQGGTNYAVGGARVTLPNALSIPITTQINNYVAAGGTFGPRDLVYIQGGGNDYFAFQAGGSVNNAILTTAATQLAAQVARVQGLGATRIVTLAVQSGGAPGLQLFNQTYGNALRAAGVNALYFDTDRLFNELVASPGTYGYTVTTTGVACTVPSSLSCNRSTLVTPTANETYVLADSVHPAGITQRIQGQAVASLIKAPEQIAGLAYAGQALFRSQRDLYEGPMRAGTGATGLRSGLFGAAAYRYYDSGDASAQRIGITERGFSATLGYDLPLGDRAGVGIAGGYGEGNGDFANETAGGYKSRAWTGSVYARGEFGPLHVVTDTTYGQVDFRNIRRTVQLGPAVRTQTGKTDGDYLAGRIALAAELITGGGMTFGPEAAVQVERLKIDGYAEREVTSTAASFGRQRLESVTGRFGIAGRTFPDEPIRFALRAGYEREFEDDVRNFAITPVGAPISFNSPVARADRDYMSYALSAEGSVFGALTLRGGVAGTALRGHRDTVTAFAGLSAAF